MIKISQYCLLLFCISIVASHLVPNVQYDREKVILNLPGVDRESRPTKRENIFKYEKESSSNDWVRITNGQNTFEKGSQRKHEEEIEHRW